MSWHGFRAGDKVVCVDDERHALWDEPKLVRGQIYTVREESDRGELYLQEVDLAWRPGRFTLFKELQVQVPEVGEVTLKLRTKGTQQDSAEKSPTASDK